MILSPSRANTRAVNRCWPARGPTVRRSSVHAPIRPGPIRPSLLNLLFPPSLGKRRLRRPIFDCERGRRIRSLSNEEILLVLIVVEVQTDEGPWISHVLPFVSQDHPKCATIQTHQGRVTTRLRFGEAHARVRVRFPLTFKCKFTYRESTGPWDSGGVSQIIVSPSTGSLSPLKSLVDRSLRERKRGDSVSPRGRIPE